MHQTTLVYLPLGPQFTCQINKCGKPAYKKCDSYAGCPCDPVWEGCGKYMCTDHMEVQIRAIEVLDKPSYYEVYLNRC